MLATSFSNAAAPNSNTDEFDSYTSPQIIGHLSDEISLPLKGPLEKIEESPSINQYYDGSLNLNVVKVSCKIYTNSGDCIHQSGCGWCGSSNGCILGTNFGPLQKCVKSTYIGGLRYPTYSPSVKIVDELVGGVTNTIINNIS